MTMEEMTHAVSSGNVFADLGLPNSEQEFRLLLDQQVAAFRDGGLRANGPLP
jgi:hypothetical protein